MKQYKNNIEKQNIFGKQMETFRDFKDFRFVSF